MRARRTLGLAAALLAVLSAGLWLGGHPAQLPAPLRDAFVGEAGGLSVEASELIERNYYREVPAGELADGALRGMVRGLRRRYGDRFSEYFSPAMRERFNEAIEGRFSGIGLSVTAVPAGLRVRQVFERSPARRAGIAVGETIVAVDGRSIAGLGANAATALIKGPEGTEVTIGVLPRGGGEARRVRLTRAEISVPVVRSRIETRGGERLGYLQLAAFSQGSHGALRRAVRKLRRRGAGGLVVDLRGNGGGLLDEAVLAASAFLPEGRVVVSTESRTQGRSVHRASGDRLWRGPLAVLIDGGTASAAEILAAALAEGAGARLLGSPSFGKGVFQQEVGLSNGGALKLTVGQYFTAEGENLAENGLRPRVRVGDRPGTRRDEAVERALRAVAGGG